MKRQAYISGIRLPRTRTGWLLLAFLFVLGLLAGLYFGGSESTTSLVGADRAFAVEDTERVQKVFLAHRDGYTATLERKDDHWVYNGQYKANPDAIRNLLNAIGTIRMQYKPPKAMEETMIRSLAGRGIKVEVYGAGDALLKTYYVGGSTPDERGTYIMMEDADQPYVGELANWQGNLRFRYNLRGDDWRDKTVFALGVDEIQQVSVAYPRQRQASFVLRRDGSDFTVEPYYPGPAQTPVAVPRGRAEAYLYGFKSLRAEAFENENPRRDSILQLIPFSLVDVKLVDGTERRVRFFPIAYGETPSGPSSPAVHRYFAWVDDRDLMLVQDRVFRELFLDYGFFVPEG